jgi:hypothetical protein
MRSLRRCSLLALLPLLSQCTDAPTEPDLESPVLQIVSVAGSPSGHFYFLPPIAAGTGFSGTFDTGLLSQLQIRVCALSSGATPACVGGDIVSFSSSTSPAILLDAVGENYSVNWSTKKGGLSTSINYRIRVFAGSLLLGFADLDVVTNKKQLASVPAEFVGLVKNGSLLIKFRVESGIVGSVVVSPSSATIVPSSTQQFTATVTDLHGSNIASPTLLWSSSNTATATVDQSGLASAVAAGTTTIKAASQGVEGTASLTVQAVSGELQATDDGYTATGNIAIAIADGTSDVLSNDQGTGTLTVSEVQGASANVGVATNTTASGIGSITGNVTLNANGSFSYDPPPGYTGTDQFTYRITDGSSSSNLATVTITVSDMMWFVCDACGGNNRGTLAHPFTSVADFTAANTGSAPAPQPNQKLYIRSGTYNGAADNLTLRDGQLAFGQGVAAATVFTPDANSVAAFAALTAGTVPVIAPTAGNGVNLGSGNTLRGFDVGSAGGIGITGTDFGALTVTGVSINTTGAGLSLTTGSASATGVAFGSITSGGGTNNIKLANLSGTNAFALGSGALSGASGNAFDVDNGTAPVSYSGTIANTTARPVRIENYDGGTIALSGAVTGSSSGVLLNANTGATVSFTGGVSLSTGANAAFTATEGGTVTATQNNSSIVNTLATTTGTALNVQNTTIGAVGLTFQSISAGTAASGPTNGIVLNATGSSGGLTVTGTGSAGTGGTIQSITGADLATNACASLGATTPVGVGIYLNNTKSPSFAWMNFPGTFGNFGILGYSVNGLMLDHSTMTGTYGDNVNQDEDAIHFCTLTGSASITNATISNGAESNLRIVNASGTLNRLTLTSNTFGLNQTTGGGGVLLEAVGGTLNATVLDNVFQGARTLPFQAVPLVGATMDLVFGAPGHGNTVHNTHSNIATFAQDLNVEAGGALTFDINSNHFDAAPAVQAQGGVFINAANSTADASGYFRNNTIGTPGVANSGSSGNSPALEIQSNGGGDLTVKVDNNQIYQFGANGAGVLVQAGATGGNPTTFNVTFTNNTIAEPGTFAVTNTAQGFQLNNGTNSGENFTSCLFLSGNLASTSGTGAGGDIRIRQRFDTKVQLPGYTGAADGTSGSPTLTGYIQGLNPSGPPTVTSVSSTVSGGGFLNTPGGAACALPAF